MPAGLRNKEPQYMRSETHQLLLRTAALAFFLSVTVQALAQSMPTQFLLALSKRDRTLAIVDAKTLQIIAHVPVGADPHEVIASSDGKTAYVSIYGGGRFHELDVIDLVAQKPLSNIDTKPLMGPHGITFTN